MKTLRERSDDLAELFIKNTTIHVNSHWIQDLAKDYARETLWALFRDPRFGADDHNKGLELLIEALVNRQ